MLHLYCNANCRFSVVCCFTATPAYYSLLCSFIRSWLIVFLTIFHASCPCFLSMLHGTLPNCWWLGTGGVLFPVLCFSYVEGVHSYDSSELFQYLIVFDTMCKKLSRQVLRQLHVQKWENLFVIHCF